MSGSTLEQMADRIAALLEERLHIRGNGLGEKLRRGGRALPRHVRDEAALLADAVARARNPRLFVQLDMARVAEAYDICQRHLARAGGGHRWRARLLDFFGSVAVNLLLVSALVVAVLIWRGYL